MAKFCSQCGRQLNDGEECTCTQQQATQTNANQGEQTTQNTLNQGTAQSATPTAQSATPAAGGFDANAVVADIKTIFSKILPIFKNPVGEIKNIAATSKTALGWEMIGINVVVTLIMMIIAMLVADSKLSNSYFSVEIPYVKLVISVTVLVAVIYAVMAGVLYLMDKNIFKSSTSFSKIVNIIGSKALIDACFIIIGILCTLLNSTLGTLVMVLGGLYSMFVMLISYTEATDVDGNKKVYSLLVTYICVLVVCYIAYSSLIQEMMTGLMGFSAGSMF